MDIDCGNVAALLNDLENIKLEGNEKKDRTEKKKSKKSKKDNQAESRTNPMLIELVIKHLLQYLNFDEVKSARFISKTWSSVGLKELKTRSKITFSQEINSCSPFNFFSTFPIESLEAVSFTKYSFFCDDSQPWTLKELNYFFRNQQKHIKELEFSQLHLVDKKRRRSSKYDISSWLLNSAMTKPNTKYNTRFAVSVMPGFNDKDSSLIFVQLNALVNIKELQLENCGVDFQEGIVIGPTKIKIEDVDFFENGKKLSYICINDIVDFSNSKEIILYYADPEHKATQIILEMNKHPDIILESLRLSGVTMVNLGACKWKVNHLYLDGVPFTESSGMQIKELTNMYSPVDISVLPQSIEKLDAVIDKRNYTCSQPTVLKNLKIMKLGIGNDSVILKFLNSGDLNCPLLVELHLNCYKYIKIQLNLIPQTIKILDLSGICICDEGINNILKLDKLVLRDYSLAKLAEVCCTQMQTANLVLSFPCKYYFKYHDTFINFLDNQNICKEDQRIFAGPFSWKSAQQGDESPLRSYVDKEAEYYVFENKVGKAIDFDKFKIEMECNFPEEDDDE